MKTDELGNGWVSLSACLSQRTASHLLLLPPHAHARGGESQSFVAEIYSNEPELDIALGTCCRGKSVDSVCAPPTEGGLPLGSAQSELVFLSLFESFIPCHQFDKTSIQEVFRPP